MDKRPIGFMDSGVGGLTVVKEAMRQLPHENFIYIGDQARLPYGPRSAKQVQQFAYELSCFLLTFNIKMLVIACNTATAEALDYIRERVTIPVVGVILPGTRAAIKATKNRHIGVIATEGTTRSQAYLRAIHQRAPHMTVTSLAAPKFVPVVESNQFNSPLAKQVVAETLAPLKKLTLDTLILGCTHYPLLRTTIQHYMGPQVTLIDSGAETVAEVSVLLDYFDLAVTDAQHQGICEFYTTAAPQSFNLIARNWLHLEAVNAHRVPLSKLSDLTSTNKKE